MLAGLGMGDGSLQQTGTDRVKLLHLLPTRINKVIGKKQLKKVQLLMWRCLLFIVFFIYVFVIAWYYFNGYTSIQNGFTLKITGALSGVSAINENFLPLV